MDPLGLWVPLLCIFQTGTYCKCHDPVLAGGGWRVDEVAPAVAAWLLVVLVVLLVVLLDSSTFASS